MSCKGFPVFLMILTLVVAGFSGCNKNDENERISSKDQIITQKIYDDCKKSDSKSCLTNALVSRTDQYCLVMDLSEFNCSGVKLEMIRMVRAKEDKEVEEINKQNEVTKQKIIELQGQNQEADRVLKK
jgi:hypothetical protein